MTKRRIGRLIVDDGRLTDDELSSLKSAINEETPFSAVESTPLRVDVFKEYDE